MNSDKKMETSVSQRPWSPDTPLEAKVPLLPATTSKYADPDPISARQDLENAPKPLSKEHFYILLGVYAPDDAHPGPRSLEGEHALYGLIHRIYEHTKWQYHAFTMTMYALLGLQLVLSALFIILGSLTNMDTHIAIAILGAISTIIGGALALMQGQGLPNRLRQLRNQLAIVVYEANMMYTDVAAGKEAYYRDIRRLREDYWRVVEESKMNHPDTWTTTATALAQAVKVPGKELHIEGKKGLDPVAELEKGRGA